MCGIAGIWRTSASNHQDLRSQIAGSIATLTHRGPDDSGVWVNEQAGLALGQRRLAILDLTAAGHQPMVSADDRMVIVYNGEVYNFRSLRQELEGKGFQFAGNSDTEVVLAAICAWGLEQALSRFVGMFALAVWDRQLRQLWLARDRMGIKPLYYYHVPGLLLFASEIKALMSITDFSREIDDSSLADFLRHLYIPSPHTIFRHTKKLLPGQYARIDGQGLQLTQYWDINAVAGKGLRERVNLSDAEAEEELDRRIRESVGLRLIADVPLGAFLSGGIDSSTVVAAMQAQSSLPVKTFTICFADDYYDEGRFAAPIAAHLGTDHTELKVTSEMAQAVIPRLPEIYDEPFADSSTIPTFLVSQLARQEVTVSLSGDGGDELFGGYLRYIYGQRLWRLCKHLSPAIRMALAKVLDKIPARSLEQIIIPLRGHLPQTLQFNLVSERLKKIAALLRAQGDFDIYRQVTSFWANPEEILCGTIPSRFNELFSKLAQEQNIFALPEMMMLIDQNTYLPDDILTKVDRASMAVSLEARVPLLDHRLVVWSWRLPAHFKIRNGQGKWLLRQVLARYVPRSFFERPKSGFSIPIGPWLRGPLEGWAEELLNNKTLKREGIFHAPVVRQCWKEHKSGVKNRQSQLWPILMFRSWKQHWLEKGN